MAWDGLGWLTTPKSLEVPILHSVRRQVHIHMLLPNYPGINIGDARRATASTDASTAAGVQLQRRPSEGALPDTPSFLRTILYSPLGLQVLSGSGATQAPLMAKLLGSAGLRTVEQSGPPGVAIFTDSAPSNPVAAEAPEVAVLWLMTGLAREQAELEASYADEHRRPLLVCRFLEKLEQIRAACPHTVDDAALGAALAPLDGGGGGGALQEGAPPAKAARTDATARPARPGWVESEEDLERCVAGVVRAAAPLLGASELQLEREWQALLSSHATLANACLARVLHHTRVHVQEARLLVSKLPARHLVEDAGGPA